ncbi:MAG: DUF1559 family PulG-like putative transporter [Gemmataceae bacterium]
MQRLHGLLAFRGALFAVHVQRETLLQMLFGPDSDIAATRLVVFLCPSDTAYNAPPRTDIGNLEGFPVGNFLIDEDIPALNNWCSWPYATHANGTCAIPPNAVQANGQPFDPNDWYNNHSFRSRHPNGLQFAFADGSVHFVTNAINLDLYRGLAAIQGGEVVNVP